MKRRDTLKALSLTSLGLAVSPTEVAAQKKPVKKEPPVTPGRTPEEAERDKKIHAQTFFTPAEMQLLTVLVDIILPADGVSGSASQAGVPAFIEFMAKDIPSHQTPLRGGLNWIDHRAKHLFGVGFIALKPAQRLQIIDEIAYPEEAKTEVKPGVAFFNRLRDLTVTGFYTTEMGFKDLDYRGNQPNAWDGVPQEVLDQYGLKNDPLYDAEK